MTFGSPQLLYRAVLVAFATTLASCGLDKQVGIDSNVSGQITGSFITSSMEPSSGPVGTTITMNGHGLTENMTYTMDGAPMRVLARNGSESVQLEVPQGKPGMRRVVASKEGESSATSFLLTGGEGDTVVAGSAANVCAGTTFYDVDGNAAQGTKDCGSQANAGGSSASVEYAAKAGSADSAKAADQAKTADSAKTAMLADRATTAELADKAVLADSATNIAGVTPIASGEYLRWDGSAWRASRLPVSDLVTRGCIEGQGLQIVGGAWTCVSSGVVGEVNAGANLGTGSTVYKDKVGTNLQFRSLVAGSNILLSSDANSVTFSLDTTNGTLMTPAERAQLSGLGSMAVQNNTGVSITGGRIAGLGVLGIIERGATPIYQTKFVGSDQTDDIVYQLPPSLATVNGQVLASDTLGKLSWASPGLDNTKLPLAGGTVTGALGVDGATTLGSTLGVTGAASFGSSLNVSGNTILNGALGVSGAASLASTLGVTGTVSVGGFKMASGAAAGRVLTSDANGAASWATVGASSLPASSITSVPAGILRGVGGEFTGSATIGTSDIADNAVTGAKIADGTISYSKLSALVSADLGKVLQWNGSSWNAAYVSGAGDMLTTTYDNSGVAGVVDNSEALAGKTWATAPLLASTASPASGVYTKELGFTAKTYGSTSCTTIGNGVMWLEGMTIYVCVGRIKVRVSSIGHIAFLSPARAPSFLYIVQTPDSYCTSVGSAFGMPFKALISDSNSAISNFTPTGDVYNTIGQRVSTAANFYSSTHENPIAYDKDGTAVTGAMYWTGATAAGGTAADNCGDFQSPLLQGTYGVANQVNSSAWLSGGTASCNNLSLRFVCISQ